VCDETPVLPIDQDSVHGLRSQLLSDHIAAHAAVDPQVQARVTTAMQALQTYPSTHAIVSLKVAIESPADYVALRRTVVQGWAEILKAIEQSYDPAFDPSNPKDLPNTCVLPDLGSVTSNVSPDQIPDPKARAAHEDALQANAVKRQRARQWHDVHMLDQEAMALLRGHLQTFAAAGAPSDYSALDAILHQAGISSSRRAKIDKMLIGPSPETHS
jgi:hypothetical protein